MGEYEERYPDAYGREETGERAAATPPAQPAAETRRITTQLPRQVRDRSLLRERFGLGAVTERVRAWQHRPAEREEREEREPAAPPPAPPPMRPGAPAEAGPAHATALDAAAAPPVEIAPEPMSTETVAPETVAPETVAPARPAGNRGRGPRGYIRSPARLYEDICDRLMLDPLVDATEIEVTVTGSEAALTGTVDSEAEYRQAQSLAEEVVGVNRVHNRLRMRDPERGRTEAGRTVNAALE